MAAALKLYVDAPSGRLVSGIDSAASPSLESFFFADEVDCEVYFLREAPRGSATRFELLDKSAADMRLHIAAGPPVTAAPYVAADTWTDLPITAGASVSRTITGGTSANETQVLEFSPEAYSGTFVLTIPSAALTFTSVTGGIWTTSGGHGLTVLQPFVPTGFTTPSGFSNGGLLYVSSVLSRDSFVAAATPSAGAILLAGCATAGTGYTLTASTTALDARATPAQVEDALEILSAVGSGNVVVQGVAGQRHTITFKAGKGLMTVPVMSVAASLTPVFGKTATLDFNTATLNSAISAAASIPATLEIELTEGTSVQTVVQKSITIRNQVIGDNPLPTPMILTRERLAFLDADGLMRFLFVGRDGLAWTYREGFPFDGALGLWPLNDFGNATGDLRDASGNGKKLSIQTTGTGSATWTATGLLGGAFELAHGAFSSEGASLVTPVLPVSTGEPFTIAAWIKFDAFAVPGTRIFGVEFDDGDAQTYGLISNGTDFVINWFGTGYSLTAEDESPTVGVWQHVAWTKSAADVSTLYLNGVAVAIGATPGYSGVTGDCRVSFGQCLAADYAPDGVPEGYLDMLGVWGRVLTADEISDLYNAGAGIEP